MFIVWNSGFECFISWHIKSRDYKKIKTDLNSIIYISIIKSWNKIEFYYIYPCLKVETELNSIMYIYPCLEVETELNSIIYISMFKSWNRIEFYYIYIHVQKLKQNWILLYIYIHVQKLKQNWILLYISMFKSSRRFIAFVPFLQCVPKYIGI